MPKSKSSYCGTMSKSEAIQKYIEVIYEWNLPPLNEKEFNEYIQSQTNGTFYTPVSWPVPFKKVKNFRNI